MARIRQIKPDFWYDSALGRVSRDARLLAIGLLNLADREGRLEDNHDEIRVRLFPYDAQTDLERWLTELAQAQFVIRYTVSRRNYLQVRNFTKHQHPHPHESASTLPEPPVKCNGKPRHVRTSRGTCTSTSTSTSGVRSTGADAPLSAETLRDLWNTEAPSLSAAVAMPAERTRHAEARLVEHPDRAWWLAYFQRLEASDFLTLRQPRPAGKHAKWKPDLDWALKPDVIARALEGKYDNRPEREPLPSSDREYLATCQHEPRCTMKARHKELLQIAEMKASLKEPAA